MLSTKKSLLFLILCVGLFSISALAKTTRPPQKLPAPKVTVPEPSSIAFAGMGLLGVAAAIRRKFNIA